MHTVRLTQIVSGWFLEDFGSVNEERHRVRIPGMAKNILNMEAYYKAAQTVRSVYSSSLGLVYNVDTMTGMEKCHMPYASVARAGRVQAWIFKAFLDVAQQDLDDVRSWVESRWFGVKHISFPTLSNTLSATSSNGEDLLKRKSSSKNFRSRL